MTRFDATQVRRYYDRHTAGFLAYGEGGRLGAIHRGVWGPGVTDREGAFHFVEDQIADLVGSDLTGRRESGPPVRSDPTQTPHVVDLGCGVGASLVYLASQLPVRGTGITLSPVQAALARRGVRDAGLVERVEILEGDFSDLPAGIGPADVAYAIESFVHAPSAERFFDQCRRLIRPGGLLVICDDFRRLSDDPAAQRAIEQFRRGWHINALLRLDELYVLARDAGLEHQSTLDLTPCLELHRTRDRAIGAFVTLLGWLPLERTQFGHLLGGSALQKSLDRGWIGYEMVVFRSAGGGTRPSSG